MKRFYTIVIILSVCWLIACKKNKVDYTGAIVGNWRYTSSESSNGTTTQTGYYDSSFVANFADSLKFTDSGVVYYTYFGITTWSNYKVPGSQLILIGGGANDTLIIHSLNNAELQLGTQDGKQYYWAKYEKY